MKLHANAALSWSGRRKLCERVVAQGWTLSAAAQAAGVSVRCARKWVGRYRLQGERGLFDRSSAPARVANRTAADRVEVIVRLRRLRFTAAEIAETLGMALSTVSGILTRLGLGRLGRLGLERPVRYEHERAGELLHIDVKRLGRIVGGAGKRVTGAKRNPDLRRVDARGVERKRIGWEYVHICVDDYSRLAYAEVLPDEKATTPDRVPEARARLLPPLRRHRRADPDRQRQRLRLRPAHARLPRAAHPAQPHPSLPAADEREGRTLHPHPAPRLGVRSHLPLKPRTHHRP
jgi:transposase